MQSKKHVEKDGKVSLTKVEYCQLTWTIEEDKEKVMIPKAFKKRTPVCQDQITKVFFSVIFLGQPVSILGKVEKVPMANFGQKKCPWPFWHSGTRDIEKVPVTICPCQSKYCGLSHEIPKLIKAKKTQPCCFAKIPNKYLNLKKNWLRVSFFMASWIWKYIKFLSQLTYFLNENFNYNLLYVLNCQKYLKSLLKIWHSILWKRDDSEK